MRRKNDVYLHDAELQQIQQVAEKKGLSVSAYMRRVSVRDARDELLEQAANRRLAADRQQRYIETFNELPPDVVEPPPVPQETEPAEPPKPLRDEPMTMEQFAVERAQAHHWHKTHLERRMQSCRHRNADTGERVAAGAICPRCDRTVIPAGSHGEIIKVHRNNQVI
jgi:hypothetical protein